MNCDRILRTAPGISLVMGAALLSAALRAQSGGNGIYVGDPKVYDNAALQSMLTAAQQKLATFSGYDQSSLTGQLGKMQGANVDQSQNSLQLNISPKPGATTQQTSQNSQPPSFTLPSSFAPSAADLLNEQTQLNFQLTSLQLLLEGALSDKFVEGSTYGKSQVTLGFPIAIA